MEPESPPGTTFAQPMSSLPGKTAPRLLHDALHIDPSVAFDTFDPLADPPPRYDPNTLPPLPARFSRHNYALKVARSFLPRTDYRPQAGDQFEAWAICRNTRVHIHLALAYPEDSLRPCPNTEFPLHHFVLSNFVSGSSYTFVCSSYECRATTTVSYQSPVISEKDMDLLTNTEYLQKRYDDAVASEPSRTGFILATAVSTLWKLRRYIRDSQKTEGEVRKIPAQNKRFLESFGTDCDELLTRLGFTYLKGTDEEPEDAWALPRPKSNSLEMLLLENWDMELQILIELFAARDGDLNPCPEYVWTPAKQPLERILSTQNYAKSLKSRTENNESTLDHPFYASLGAMRDFSDELIAFAFDRQSACDPENGPYYFDCLSDLAIGRESEVLNLKASTLSSQGVVGRKAIDSAYRYLGFNTHDTFSDQTIIDRYQSRLVDTGPSGQAELRDKLKTLATARQSSVLADAANDTINTYPQALLWLGAESHYTDEAILTLFAAKVGDSPADETLARRAVKVIAESRNSDPLRSWLATGEMRESGMTVEEACAHLKIQLDNVDEGMLQLVFDSARSDKPGWQTDQAIDVVTKAYQRPKEEPQHTAADWPVGLTSHGNTCYLNSLLQYYFTVKPLRELVLNFEEHRFDLAAHGGKEERVGSRKVTPLEIRAYQKFVEDLKHLFERMIRDPGPAVKPEADLVCRAFLQAEETETQTALPSRAQSPPADIGIEQPTPQYPADAQSNQHVEDTQMTLSVGSLAPKVAVGSTELPPSPPASPDKEMQDVTSLSVPILPPRDVPTPIRQQTNLTKAEEAARQQQDVTEVMDEILFRLRCAVKPYGMDNREEQLDKLRDIFYMKISEKTIDDAGKAVSREEYALNILLNIPSRPTDIYTALDEIFELQTIDHGDKKLKQYKTLQSLPPILQINIPRITYDRATGRGVKVDHKVHLEESLYLDRYFEWDAPEIMQRREQCWQWRQQLAVLQAQRDVLNRNAATELEGPVKLQTVAKHLKNLQQSNEALESLGLAPIEFDASLIDDLDSMANAMQSQLTTIDEQMASLQHNITSSFEDHKQIKYRLHSVFFHRGGYGHGHYWSCIYDFEHSIWRVYNDERVDKLTNVNDIFDAQTWQQGTPTYAVYVKDDVKEQFVQALCREPAVAVVEEERPPREAFDEVMQDSTDPPPVPQTEPPPKPEEDRVE